MRLAVATSLIWLNYFCALPADTASASAEALSGEPSSVYFWNEVTGDTQYEDPGDVPLHDEEGNCFWLDEHGNKLDRDPNAGKYAWIETWSEEHKLPFYYDQVNKVSTWDKPADLAWRRVYIDPEASQESPSNLEQPIGITAPQESPSGLEPVTDTTAAQEPPSDLNSAADTASS